MLRDGCNRLLPDKLDDASRTRGRYAGSTQCPAGVNPCVVDGDRLTSAKSGGCTLVELLRGEIEGRAVDGTLQVARRTRELLPAIINLPSYIGERVTADGRYEITDTAVDRLIRGRLLSQRRHGGQRQQDDQQANSSHFR